MKIRIVSSSAQVAALICGVLVAVMGETTRADNVSFSDGDFSTGWSVTQIGATGSVAGMRVASGGNPGAFWQVTNNVVTSDIEAISLCSNFTIDPAETGPIESLSFSYDAVTYIDGQGQGTAPALLQDGVIFEDIPENTQYYSSYASLSFANLTADDFTALNGTGAHPDFSATGSTITLGFGNGNSGGYPYSYRTTQSDYDNFSVTVNYTPIPEPGTWALVGVGAGVMGVTLRRPRAAA